MSSLAHLTAVLAQRPSALVDLPWRRLAARGRRLSARLRASRPLYPGLLPDRLAVLLGEAVRAPVWCNGSRRDSIVAALTPAMRQRALERAERLLAGEVEIFGQRFAMPPAGGRWDRDLLSGYRWPTTDAATLKLSVAGADVKYAWALGRLDEPLALAMAARLVEDPARRFTLQKAALDGLISFHAHNPPGRGVQWTCAMEVGLRSANIAQLLHLLADFPPAGTPEAVAAIAGLLHAHVQYVWDNLEDEQAVPNNHLVAGLVGQLVTLSLVPGLPGAWDGRQRARERLLRELREQVDEEGVAFEGSIPYHRLSLEMFVLGFIIDRALGGRWPAWAHARLTRMFEAALALSSSSGTLAQIGDNDAGRGLPLVVRGALDVSHLPSLGAALLEAPQLKLADDAPSDELAWLLGREGVEAFDALEARARRRSRSFVNAGLHVLEGAGATVVVSAGPQGQAGVGGHSHLDKLSFELHLHGRPCIVDVGTGTYTRTPGLRNRMRSTAMHNTVQIDGEEQAPLPETRLFALPARTGATAARMSLGQSVDGLAVRHDGYGRLGTPIRVWRRFQLDREARALGVEDLIEGRGLHVASWRLHLAGTGARFVPLTDALRARVLATPGGPQKPASHALQLSGGGAYLVFEAGSTPVLEHTVYSPGYGQTETCQRVLFGAHVALPVCWRWAVLWE